MVHHEGREDLYPEAERFMDLLHHELAAEERIEIRYRKADGGSMLQRFFSTAKEAASEAIALGRTAEVYVGVATRLGEVGTKDRVSRIGALWADLDLKGDNTSKVRAGQMRDLACRPSIIVWSGNGYHAYWLLKESAKSQEDLEKAERAMGLLAAGLEGDPVQDRSRILRVPGTFNHKYGEPKPVSFELCKPEVRYGLDDLLEFAEALPKNSSDTVEGANWVRRDVLSDPIIEGHRNVVLVSVAGSLRDRGLDSETIRTILLEVNRMRCDPPLEESEVVSVGKAISKYPPGVPRYRGSSTNRVYRKEER